MVVSNQFGWHLGKAKTSFSRKNPLDGKVRLREKTSSEKMRNFLYGQASAARGTLV